MSNRILGANGLPHGTPSPVVRHPGETQCHITTGLGPGGPVLVIQMGQAAQPIPLPADVARQLGVGLISLAALHDARATPREFDGVERSNDDLLAQAAGNRKLRGPEDDEHRHRKHDQPDTRPDGPCRSGGGPGDGPAAAGDAAGRDGAQG